jgi:hypothetical protein
MIGFDLKISRQKVEQKLYELIQEMSPTSKIEVNSFEVSIEVIASPKIEINGMFIKTTLPLSVSFVRNAALFTVSGHGKLNAEISTQFDINSSFQLSTKSSIKNHNWIEKPVIDFGSLDITVEKLIDLVLKHYESMIGATIDKSIKDTLDLSGISKSAIAQLRSKLSTMNYKGINLYIEPTELLLEPIESDNQHFKARGSLRADVACSSSNPYTDNGFLLRWVETLLSDNITYIHIDITENIISDLLCEFVNSQQYGGENLVSNACKVDFQPGKLNIDLNLIKPIAATVHLKGKPRYNESESKIYIDDLDIDLNASNFIYKLTAPLINKFMESSIKENFPVDVDLLIKTHLTKYLKGSKILNEIDFSHSISSVSLMELKFQDTGITAIIKVSDAEVAVAY